MNIEKTQGEPAIFEFEVETGNPPYVCILRINGHERPESFDSRSISINFDTTDVPPNQYTVELAVLESYQDPSEAIFKGVGTLTVKQEETPTESKESSAKPPVSEGAQNALQKWKHEKHRITLELFTYDLLHTPKQVIDVAALKHDYTQIVKAGEQLYESAEQSPILSSSVEEYNNLKYFTAKHIEALEQEFSEKIKKLRKFAKYLQTHDPKQDPWQNYYNLTASELGDYLKNPKAHLNLRTIAGKQDRAYREQFINFVRVLYENFYKSIHDNLETMAEIVDRWEQSKE